MTLGRREVGCDHINVSVRNLDSSQLVDETFLAEMIGSLFDLQKEGKSVHTATAVLRDDLENPDQLMG